MTERWSDREYPFGSGAHVGVRSPGHKKDGADGVVVEPPMGTTDRCTVLIDGERYGFTRAELVRLR